jgi:RimJ/RimL family protein N-acetyltransferase
VVILETERLILRVLEKNDLDSFFTINNDPDVMKYFPTTVNKIDTKKMISNEIDLYKKYGYCLLACVIKENHTFIGFVGLKRTLFNSSFTPAIEVGWRLNKDYWNKGYATEAAKAVIKWGFEKIGLKEIVSFTSRINKPSIRVMEKCGLTYNSKDDFLHPNLKDSDLLTPHVLYRIKYND